MSERTVSLAEAEAWSDEIIKIMADTSCVFAEAVNVHIARHKQMIADEKLRAMVRAFIHQ